MAENRKTMVEGPGSQEPMAARHLFISGRVQGVFFRAHTQDLARRLGLHGWVRNLPDGRVEVKVWGDPDRVEELVAWCHQGPPAARVTHVAVGAAEPEPGVTGFHVRL